MSKEEERGKRGRKVEQLKGRERANSTSILEFVQGKKEEAVKNKRKREEIKKQAEESFKRHNIMMRTPPGVKRAEEKEGETEKKEEKMEWEGALIMMLKKLKEEMVGMNPGKNGLKEKAKAFLEKEFGAKESIKEVQLIRRESGRGVESNSRNGEVGGKRKDKMKEKSKLYGRNFHRSRYDKRGESGAEKTEGTSKKRKERRKEG